MVEKIREKEKGKWLEMRSALHRALSGTWGNQQGMEEERQKGMQDGRDSGMQEKRPHMLYKKAAGNGTLQNWRHYRHKKSPRFVRKNLNGKRLFCAGRQGLRAACSGRCSHVCGQGAHALCDCHAATQCALREVLQPSTIGAL